MPSYPHIFIVRLGGRGHKLCNEEIIIIKKILLIRVSLTFSDENVQFPPSCKDTQTRTHSEALTTTQTLMDLFLGISRFSDEDAIVFLLYYISMLYIRWI